MLTPEQTEQLQMLFKKADTIRLLHGPDEEEALFFHGWMSGMREELEAQGLSVAGITGLWWYEEMDGDKTPQKTISELVEKYENEDWMIPVLKGRVKGAEIVRKVLSGSELDFL